MEKTVVGIIGPRGSGKDYASRYWHARYGASVHKGSAPISACIDDLGIERTSENLVAFSLHILRGRPAGEGLLAPDASIEDTAILRCLDRLLLPTGDAYATFRFRDLLRRLPSATPGFGEDVFAKVIAKRCAEDPAPIVIANGLRLHADVEALSRLPRFHLVYVTASEEFRFNMVRNRQEKMEERGLSIERFRAFESLPTEIEIPRIGDTYASFRFVHEQMTPEAYHAFLDHVISQVRQP